MARGQVFNQASGTGQIIETTSREEMNAVAVLNPNDGVVYLKLNGPAGPTPSQWDWKLPSQSYGLFPGPWVSLGVYYIDQSGSGRNAELNVYDSVDKMYTPYIVAIGRAVQQAGTTVDISVGNQPQNPPANTARLWIDAQGNLNILQSNGTNYEVLDSSNFAGYVQPLINSSIASLTLGGDLTGTIPNGHVRFLTIDNSGNFTHTGSGAFQGGYLYLNTAGDHLQGDNANLAYRTNGTHFFQNRAGSALANMQANDLQAQSISLLQGSNQVIYWRDGSHYLQYAPAGALNLLAWTHDFQAKDIHANRDNTSGYLYFGGNNTHYMGFDGNDWGINPTNSGHIYLPQIITQSVVRGSLEDTAAAHYCGAFNNNATQTITGTGWQRISALSFTTTVHVNKCVMITWNFHWMHNGTQANLEFGISMDSMATFFQQLSVQQNSFANQVMTCSGSHVFTQNEVPSGTHTFDLYVYNGSGTFSLWSNDRHQFSVTELLTP